MASKLRSSLTMLGVIIGVGAVITLMAAGRGVEQGITSTMEDLGTNTLSVISQTPGVSGLAAMQSATPSLTIDDAEAILARVPGIIAVAPVSENFVEISYGDESTTAIIEGSTPEFEIAYNYQTAAGRFITDRDVATRDTVVVLGTEIVENLFGDDDAVGKTVKISGRRFTVVGVMEEKGGQMMGYSMDEIIVVPITTFQARLFPGQTRRGEESIQQISVKIASLDMAEVITEDISDLLRRRHHIAEGDDDDFAVISMEQVLGIMTQITGVLTLFLGAIAGISLLVGSIGIMNIMLVSVTERTREIGLRKAVGAKRRDILLQFLFEAASISLVGGVIGIIGGWLAAIGISIIATQLGFPLDSVVSPDIILLAASVSVIIGLISGIYPAMRAARLNPIDALHYG
ncbi:ABC transporter permease [Chloroflexota bacterium]